MPRRPHVLKALAVSALTLSGSACGNAHAASERSAPSTHVAAAHPAAVRPATNGGATNAGATSAGATSRTDATPNPTEPQTTAGSQPTNGAATDDEARFPSLFFGENDDALRRSLATSPLASAKKGGGGRSVGFKITLADGTVGYFKPEQEFSGAHWFSELAAHYLDRELGFGRVTPASGRVFEWSRLRPLLGSDPRVGEVTVRPDGTARGAFLAWIPGGIEPLPLGRGWEKWVRRDGPLARTPYTALGSARDREAPPSTVAGEPDTGDRAAELSDLLVFDYLIQNVDRWGSNNTNVRTKGRGGPLLFFDNGAGFWFRIQRLPLMESRLRPVQRFRRSTIDAIRRFDRTHFEARLARDPLAPLLTDEQLDGLEERCRAVLAHVEAMQARYGDAIWF